HRVLFYGILGALVFRGIFISLGALLMQFHWVVWLFGAFLIVTGLRMLRSPEEGMDPGRNPVIRLVGRALPGTHQMHGQHFLVPRDGRRWATPLLVDWWCVEGSGIVLGMDWVPAIFAMRREPFIVFTSNVFAILGLRSMYF